MKLTKDRLKQIVKEELEEIKGFRNLSRYSPEKPNDEINVGLNEPNNSKTTKPIVKHFRSKPHPISDQISKIAYDKKFNLGNIEDAKKLTLLGDLVSSLETEDGKVNYNLKKIKNDGHNVDSLLNFIDNSELKNDIQNLLSNKGIQENLKLTRDRLKQIIKEELEEIMSEGSGTVKMTLQGKPVQLMVKRFGLTNFVTIYDARSMEEISKYEVSLPDPKTGGSPLIDHMSGQDFESDTKEWSKIQSAMMKMVSGGLNEADIKVSVSAEDQKLKKDLERVAGYTGAQVLKVDGKMYVCQKLGTGKLSVHHGDDTYIKYLDSSGRTEKPKPVEDPQVLAKVSSMLQTKPLKRR